MVAGLEDCWPKRDEDCVVDNEGKGYTRERWSFYIAEAGRGGV